jgi:TRAP-type C4-dicarboxylate transport system permease small subunit
VIFVFLKADRVVEKSIRYISYTSGVCLVGIMLVAFFNVLGEKMFHRGIPASTEIVQYLHIPVVFLACAFVTIDRGQVRIDLLFNLLGAKLQSGLSVLGDVLGILICAFIAARGFVQTGNFIERHAMSSISGIGFPLWPFGTILWFGFALFAFSFFWCILRRFNKSYQERLAGLAAAAEAGAEGEAENEKPAPEEKRIESGVV